MAIKRLKHYDDDDDDEYISIKTALYISNSLDDVPISKHKSTERKLYSTKPTPIILFDGFIPDVGVVASCSPIRSYIGKCPFYM
jgi:hypothetical protein